MPGLPAGILPSSLWMKRNRISWLDPDSQSSPQPYFLNFQFHPSLLPIETCRHCHLIHSDPVKSLDWMQTKAENVQTGTGLLPDPPVYLYTCVFTVLPCQLPASIRLAAFHTLSSSITRTCIYPVPDCSAVLQGSGQMSRKIRP